MPSQPIPKSIASPGLLAQVISAKFLDALPLYRQAQIFERIGIELSRSSLAQWVIQAGELVQPLIIPVGCFAHARRRFDEALKAQGKKKTGHAWRGLKFIQKLYRIERSIKEAKPEARYAARHEQAKRILEKLRAWLDEVLPQTPPTSVTGKALNYLNEQWPELVRYLGDGRLRIDNNLIENAIRPFVVGRKNFLFCDTVKGATASANLYSLLETAKANGVAPYAYLRRVFTELPNANTVADIEALLPFRLAEEPRQAA